MPSGMWPFRFRTIFKNRWWTLAFVAFVCWQAIDTVGSGTNASGNSATTDTTGEPVDAEQMKAMTDALNAM